MEPETLLRGEPESLGVLTLARVPLLELEHILDERATEETLLATRLSLRKFLVECLSILRKLRGDSHVEETLVTFARNEATRVSATLNSSPALSSLPHLIVAEGWLSLHGRSSQSPGTVFFRRRLKHFVSWEFSLRHAPFLEEELTLYRALLEELCPATRVSVERLKDSTLLFELLLDRHA
jgi:hypothetical protein